MERLFKVRPISGKVKDGPFQAIISDQHLAQFGGQNQSTAWIVGETPIQVLLWREVPSKGQSQTSVGRVILLSDVVRQLAGLSLGDEVKIIPDGETPAKATELKVSCSQSMQLAVTSETRTSIQEALVDSAFITCGQEVNAGGHTWKIREINHSLVGGLYSVSNVLNVEFILDDSHETPSKLKREGIHGLDDVLDSIDHIWTRYRPGVSAHLVDISPGLTAVLLTGQHDVGKTMILDAVAKLAWPKVFRLSNQRHVTENDIQDVFSRATLFGRSLVIMDEIDELLNARNKASNLVKALINTLREIRPNSGSRVLLVAAAPSVDQVDRVLFRRGGFERHFRLRLPDLKAREHIIQGLLTTGFRGGFDGTEIVEEVAKRTPAFSPGDLERLCVSIQHHKSAISDCDISGTRGVWLRCISTALGEVHPETMEGMHVEVPTTRFTDIGGQAKLKQFLMDNVQHTLSDRTKVGKFPLRPAKGLLMYGPPGCSKTLFAKAVATEFGLNFLLVNPGALINSYVGESEKQIREVFRRARDATPCVIFFDEFETLGSDRDASLRGLNTTQTLLTEIDGVTSLEGVFILAATNRPQSIDSALLREGRLTPFMVGPPDEAGRHEILDINLSVLKTDCVGDIDRDSIMKVTAGCTGAEMVGFIKSAMEFANDEDKMTGEDVRLEQRHFEAARKRMRKSVDEETLESFREWGDQVRFS